MSTATVKCLKCKKSFEKATNQIKRSPNHYCSTSCAAKANNKKYIKRKLEGKCKVCHSSISSSATYCKKCWKIKHPKPDNRTIKEVGKYQGSGRYSLIREHARKLLNGSLGTCEFCGYSKHTQVCHVKAIKDFDKSCTVAEVNAPMNLLVLCPNCHWELDHELLED